eukprot:8908410-Pyramimonas_sp.AAC.1
METASVSLWPMRVWESWNPGRRRRLKLPKTSAGPARSSDLSGRFWVQVSTGLRGFRPVPRREPLAGVFCSDAGCDTGDLDAPNTGADALG